MTQVIIDDVIPRTQLIATAGQTVFNTNWTANAATDINVYARADGVPADDVTQLVSSSDYNVTFIGGSQTVRVTFLVGRTLDDVITIARNTPADRMNLYINTNFVPSMLNEDFGILTLVDQQAQMYDTVIAPHYNVSATIDSVIDVILPVLEANQIWAMNTTRTAIVAYDVPSSGGLAPDNGKYIVQQPDVDLPDAQAISSLASGLIVGTTTTGVLLSRILTGTANQISIANGSGIGGNPTVSITDNPIIGGTAGMGIPQGTTAQRVTPSSGIGLRYNTDLQDLEYWDGAQWVQLAEAVGEALTAVDDVNVTLALGGTPLTALFNAVSLTLGWAGELSPVRGGTGINNGTNTLTLAGNLETAGAFNSVFTMTANTAVTFPTSGTLLTASGAVTSLSATANQTTVSAATGAVTTGLANNAVLPGSAGVTLPQGNTAARAGAAGTIRFNTQTSLFEVTVDGATWVTLDTHTGGDVDSITGTADQIIASSPTGNVTLSLPQSIATTSSPTFAGLTLTNPKIAGAGGLTSFQIFTSGTAQTYTRPAGITSILVEVLGGGGAGGGCTAGGAGTVAVAGGGGAGGYARLWVPSAASSYTYTVGAGGTPGAAGAAGGVGGTTTFSASSLQATGGSGASGTTSVANTGGGISSGAAGGVGSNGNFNCNGQRGDKGVAIVGLVSSGAGGSSIYGAGGAPVTVADGSAGLAYGSGGSGGSTGTTTNRAGGAGSAGLIIVWEFC